MAECGTSSKQIRCEFDYICVIDFEATCEKNNNRDFYPHEVIEFPAVLIDVKELIIIDKFHSFVKPLLNPELTDFCKELTGISQLSVDEAEPFKKVWEKFNSWLHSRCQYKDFVILTDGFVDINKFLILECVINHLTFPSYARKYIDIKQIFRSRYKQEQTKLQDMLQFFKLSFYGRLHSGKDDAFNIARVALAMIADGCDMKFHRKISASNFMIFESKIGSYVKEKRKLEVKKRNNM